MYSLEIPWLICSMMCPLYFVLRKILRIEEKVPESEKDNLVLMESCHLEKLSTEGKCSDTAFPSSQFVEVPHINQLFSWDCGLACALMALTTLGVDDCSIQTLSALCCTSSIWTIDLAYLLQKFSVNFSYFTVTYGANPNYSLEMFYKEQLPNDLARVDMLFQKALEARIDIQCRSLSGKEISFLILSGKYIAIALVDQYKLKHSWIKDVCLSGLRSSGYIGHYIIICGYDAESDEFEIRDPASSRKHERISSKCLEEARKSFGTDEDLLLISLEKNEKQSNLPPQPSHLDAGC